MAKRKATESAPGTVLTVDCLCGGDEMECSATAVTLKHFRKFFCKTCHSTLWLSGPAFTQADVNQKIMER
jgi:RNase P subunit RPR2